jgi:ATP-dependent helicase/nuclease subunit B
MKLLIGPSNSGKTSQVISLLADALGERGSRLILIVPSERAAGEMKQRLDESVIGRSIVFPRQVVTTFPTLYTSILNYANHSMRWISEIERYRLIRKVVGELNEAGKLEYFDSIADKPGLIAALAGFIDELWRSGATPEDFVIIARARSGKDRDIARIFAAYSTDLAAAGETDAEGAGLLALKALEEIATASRGAESANAALPFSLVAADGFNFYNRVQVRLLSLLSSLGVKVVTTLTYEENRAIHIWQGPTHARLAAHATEVVACATTPANAIDLAAINFMRDDESVSTPRFDSFKEIIKITSAPDRLTEVREVAREIKRLTGKERYGLDQIAVVCRSLQSYTPQLERVFDEHAIPLKCDRSAALGENPLIVALMRLLSLSEKSFQRRVCLDCLRSPYFDFSFAELDANSIDTLDRLSMSENVIRGCDQWREAIIATGERVKRRDDIDRLDEEAKDDDAKEDRQARYSRLCDRMNALFEALSFANASTRSDCVEALHAALEKLKVNERLAVSQMAARDRVALETFLKLVSTLSNSRHDRTGEASWSDFLNEIANAVASSTYVSPSFEGPAVVAQEIHNLRPRRYRALFILGMVEGEFPIRSTERSPYTLFEREELRRAGLDLTETPADAGADLSQFYRAISLATDRLFLSFPRTDLAGGELLPSYLLDEVKLVASTEEIRIAPAYSKSERQLSKENASLQELASATAARMRERLLERGEDEIFVDPQVKEAQQFLSSNLRSWPNTLRAARVERGRLKGNADRFGGIIESNLLINLLNGMFGPNHMWNAGQINDYGICPFRFFAKHVLGLGRLDQPAEGFLANQLGTAYHRILEDVYLRLSEQGIQITPDAISTVREVAEQAGESALETMVNKRELRKNALWEFEKSEIKRRIGRLLEKESSWNAETPAKPKHFERAFGKSGEQPLLVKDEDGHIKICGVIDRIDEREDGYVVIDYKTGRTPINYNEALDGRNLQLPIYMMAAIRVVSPGAHVAAGYYLHINSRKRGSELPHKDDPGLSVDAMIEHAEKRIRDYAQKARRGRFPVSPNKGRCPNYCEFEVMCRIHSISGVSTEESGQA